MDDQQILHLNGGDMSNQQHPGPSHDDVEGKIFVGGLSWQTTEESMRFHFEKFGELSDIAIMIDKRTGQPRGFGFITMKDPAAADIVVSTEHTIDGRVVDVKRAVPRDMAPAPTRAESKKIFVGGLPTEVTEKEFADYFGTFGLVKDVVVMVDRATNRSRGFGFVTFETEEAVEAVMRNKCELMGKWVEVKRAEPRDSSRDTMRGVGGLMGGPMGMQMDGYSGGMNGGGRGGRGGGMGVGGYGGGPGRGGGYGGVPGGRGGGGMQYGAQGPQGYGGQQGYNPQGYGGPRGGAQTLSGGYGGVRYPAGYGGAAAATGMNRGVPSAGGYPAAQMYAQQNQPMGFYGYGFNAQTGQQMPGGYGGPAAGARPSGAPEENGSANAYGGAATMQQGYPYGGAAMSGYGGPYNMAAGYGAAGSGGIQGGGALGPQGQGVPGRGGPVSQDASFNETGYGAYRGQGAAQGRVDRSYRPY